MLLLTLTAIGVFRSQVKEAIFAAITSLTLHGVFTDTLTGHRITQTAAFRTSWVAITC